MRPTDGVDPAALAAAVTNALREQLGIRVAVEVLEYGGGPAARGRPYASSTAGRNESGVQRLKFAASLRGVISRPREFRADRAPVPAAS